MSKGGIHLVEQSEEQPEVQPYGRILAVGDEVVRKMRRVVWERPAPGMHMPPAPREETDDEVRARLVGRIATFKGEHANVLNFDPVGTKEGIQLVAVVLFTIHTIHPSDEIATALGADPLPISVEQWCELAVNPELRADLRAAPLIEEPDAEELAAATMAEIDRAGKIEAAR